MKSNTIQSFVHYVEVCDLGDLYCNVLLFRGQSREGNLLPGIARLDPNKDTTNIEKKMIDDLKLMGVMLLPAQEDTDLDTLVRAQHYGLKTRLLDWTSNPLAALWFACSHPGPGDAFVYGLDAEKITISGSEATEDPFRLPHTRAFQPRFSDPRIVAQHGWFTIHRYSKEWEAFVPLERNKETADNLLEFRIPESEKPEMLRSLDRIGVNARTLFPDLKGLCEYLNWRNSKEYELIKSKNSFN